MEFTNGANLFLTHEIVNKMLIQKIGEVENQAKSLINLHGLEQSVLENPLVEDVKVYVTLKGMLKTIVTQRTPVARVNTGKEVYYIDKQGGRMPLSANYSARVLLVSGNVNEGDLQDVFGLINTIQADEFLNKMIVGVQKNAVNEYVLRTRLYDQQILIGEIEELNRKVKKLKVFYKKAIQDKEIEKYKTINLKYANQVVCTKS